MKILLSLLMLGSASARILGKTCHCSGQGFQYHKYSQPQAVAVSRMLGQVAGPVTSRAVLVLLRRSRGHGPISTCDQQELNKMDVEFQACLKRAQYQIKCCSKGKLDQCIWIQAFIDHCTKGVLGTCLPPPLVSYVLATQQWFMAGHKLPDKIGLSSSCWGDDGNKLASTPPLNSTSVRDDSGWFNRAMLLKEDLLHPHLVT